MQNELVYIDDVPIGRVVAGVFYQTVTPRHIYRRLNAKGIDVSLFFRLRQVCHTWQIIFTDTRQVLSIPFAKIPAVATKRKVGSAGEQFLVKLSDFNQERPVVQLPLVREGG